MIPSVIEPATFWLVAQWLNQLSHLRQTDYTFYFIFNNARILIFQIPQISLCPAQVAYSPAHFNYLQSALIKLTTNRVIVFTALQLFCRGGTLLVAQLVEVLRYKPEGRGFDSR